MRPPGPISQAGWTSWFGTGLKAGQLTASRATTRTLETCLTRSFLGRSAPSRASRTAVTHQAHKRGAKSDRGGEVAYAAGAWASGLPVSARERTRHAVRLSRHSVNLRQSGIGAARGRGAAVWAVKSSSERPAEAGHPRSSVAKNVRVHGGLGSHMASLCREGALRSLQPWRSCAPCSSLRSVRWLVPGDERGTLDGSLAQPGARRRGRKT
jgi:hypothetical protein